jgi:flagellar hook assembly protein FlgD
LPHAPVYWITVQENFNDLVIATYGRGFWILDDLTPIQQMNPAIRESAAALFPTRPAYRFRNTAVPFSMTDDPTAGQNPPYGAAINYYLKTPPSGDVKIRIENAKGETVRTLTGTKTAGINRVYWDLRGELSKEVRLRTTPEYAPDIKFGVEGWRALPDGGRLSLLLPPGTYKVTLTGVGPELSQPLIIKKDPNSTGSDADITAQIAMLAEVRQDLDTAAEMVNQIETLRSQLYKLAPTHMSEPPAVAGGPAGGAGTTSATVGSSSSNARPAAANTPAAVTKAAASLDRKLIAIEENLIQRRLTGQGQDTVRWPPKLISKINYLAGGLSSADFAPTNQQREVHALFKSQLTSHRTRLDKILEDDLKDFNRLLRDNGLQPITW